MPMHFIHRFDRLHMRLADSPQGKPVPAEASPVREAGIDPDNTRILAQFETQGTATATSSIYAVRYGSSEGDQAVTGLTNEGVNVRRIWAGCRTSPPTASASSSSSGWPFSAARPPHA